MGDVYLVELANWLREAGLNVIEYEGWQTRARGSGGYTDTSRPWVVMWHHTASPASWDGKKDADYCAVGDEDAPVSNLYIERSGAVWVLAAGATNTNGLGGPFTCSKGTVPLDSMNSYALGVEMGNDGVGENWPEVQVNSMFVVSNVCNTKLGNELTDICTHNVWAPNRKIDPARAEAVLGSWAPRSSTTSGTWHLEDIAAECLSRGPTGASESQPEPPAVGGANEMAYYRDDRADGWQIWVVAIDAIGNAWTCPISDLPDGGKWHLVNPIVGDPPVKPFNALCDLMNAQNRPTAVA